MTSSRLRNSITAKSRGRTQKSRCKTVDNHTVCCSCDSVHPALVARHTHQNTCHPLRDAYTHTSLKANAKYTKALHPMDMSSLSILIKKQQLYISRKKCELFSIYAQCGCALTVYQGMLALEHNHLFREMFIKTMQQSTFAGYYFQMPGVTANTKDSVPFQYVLLQTNFGNTQPDPFMFRAYFKRSTFAVFPSLTGNTTLIAPRPKYQLNYLDLKHFVDGAPMGDVHSFWQLVSFTFINSLGTRRLWLNTHGKSVPWLHMRIDLQSNHILYKPFKK